MNLIEQGLQLQAASIGKKPNDYVDSTSTRADVPEPRDQPASEVFVVFSSAGPEFTSTFRQGAIEHARDFEAEFMVEFGPITVERYVHESAISRPFIAALHDLIGDLDRFEMQLVGFGREEYIEPSLEIHGEWMRSEDVENLLKKLEKALG